MVETSTNRKTKLPWVAQRQFGYLSLSNLHCAQNLDQEYAGSVRGSNTSVQYPADVMPHLAFSVTTEGSIHELWLQFRRPGEEDFYR
jgi:hypothetical protein